jgi:predicted phosphodiesterase
MMETLGLITDVHDNTLALRLIIREMQREKVPKIVVLGDVTEPHTAEANTQLLSEAGAMGVYGNHDFAFSKPESGDYAWLIQHFSGAVFAYMATLRAQMSECGLLLNHGPPSWGDPAVDIIDYMQRETLETPEEYRREFALVGERIIFTGHTHRFRIAECTGNHCDTRILEWDGTTPVVLDPDKRHFVEIGAAQDGHYAIYDLATKILSPRRVEASL